jgi:hypothetical protein
MIATIVARHSPQDVALTRAMTKNHVVRTDSDNTRVHYRATERRWNPQSREARFVLEPISA